jgi:hypothetical protein
MELQPLDVLNGLLSLVVVSFSFYIGIRIILKYFQYKKKEFLYVGLVAIITSQPWWPHVVSFFSVLILKNRLPTQIYFILGNILIPFAILFWLMTLVELLFKKNKKKIISLGIIYLISFEIIFVSLLVINPAFIGVLLGAVDVQYSIISIGLLLTALAIILPTGLAFAMESLKSGNPEIKLKGRFLRIAFISYCVGASIDVIILSNEYSLTISRILLSIAAIYFFFGYIPPDFLKKISSKEKKTKIKEKKVIKKKSEVEEKPLKNFESKKEINKNLEQIRLIMTETSRIKTKTIQNYLDLDEATFGEKILDWGSKYDLTIERDYFIINEDKVLDFIKELNDQSSD